MVTAVQNEAGTGRTDDAQPHEARPHGRPEGGRRMRGPGRGSSMDGSLDSSRGQAPRGASPARALCLGLAASLALSGCSTIDRVSQSLGLTGGVQPGQPGYVTGFLGGAAADDPRAVLVARDVLSRGGSAADAATAAALVMTVTLPSRAGLGGGGACLSFDPRRGATDAITFPAEAPGHASPGADRPAAVPLMARGLYALQARAGRRPFEELVAPAETLARFGAQVSRPLATDFATVGAPLLADPRAGAVFRGVTAEGSQLVQPELANTLSRLRTTGVGDLYLGAMARQLAEGSVPAGGGLRVEDLRDAIPRLQQPLTVRTGSDLAAFAPLASTGGVAAAVTFQALQNGESPAAAQARGLAAASAARGGADPAALLANPPPPAGSAAPLPASSSLVVVDRDGGAVSCNFSMNNLFGTGRMVPGLGFLLAAAPRPGGITPPLLSPVLVSNVNIKALRYAGAGSGQDSAPLAAALPAAQALARRVSLAEAMASVPEPGRGAAVGCPDYLPGNVATCQAAVDPRGGGLALMGRGN